MGEPFECKFEFGPFTFDPVALLQRWRKPDPETIAASRFLKLFQDHGIARTQIPRFFPQVTFDKLRTPEALLPMLNDEVLEQAAKLFGVQRSWLEGVEDQIYQPLHCYKNPAQFFEDLAELPERDTAFPLQILYSGKLLDAALDRYQPLVLLLEERLQAVGREEIYRYRIYGDGWDWNHYGARIQLKAMARAVHLAYKWTIPMFRVPLRVLKAVEAGKRVPRECLRRCPRIEPYFEDYVLSEEESPHARECEELQDVLAYIQKHSVSLPERGPNLPDR